MRLNLRAASAALLFVVAASIGFAYLPNKGPSIDRILLSEGSEYTNDPEDPGGPTRWGVTLTDVRQFIKKNATAADVKKLTRAQAVEIFGDKYWDVIRADDLPSGLDFTAADYSVNSGFGRAGRVLRQILGLPTNDWHVTQDVLDAIKGRAPTALIRAMNAERSAFLHRLATCPRFCGGWDKRVRSVNAISLQLATTPTAVPAPSAPVTDWSSWIPSNPFVRFTPLTPQQGPGKGQ